MRAGEQRIAGLVEDLDRALGRQRIGPHQHRLIRFPREVLEFRQIGFKERRATRCDHNNDAVDRGGAGDQPRELCVAELLHALRGGIDWICDVA